jgi:hypothetical protein
MRHDNTRMRYDNTRMRHDNIRMRMMTLKRDLVIGEQLHLQVGSGGAERHEAVGRVQKCQHGLKVIRFIRFFRVLELLV